MSQQRRRPTAIDLKRNWRIPMFPVSAAIPSAADRSLWTAMSLSEAAKPSSYDQCGTGQITVVATGNIWIATALSYRTRTIRAQLSSSANGMPSLNNPNVIGLVAKESSSRRSGDESVHPSILRRNNLPDVYVPIGRSDTPNDENNTAGSAQPNGCGSTRDGRRRRMRPK